MIRLPEQSINEKSPSLSGCVTDENGVDNYASLILRTDHPQYAAVVSEFGNTIQVLNNKPKD